MLTFEKLYKAYKDCRRHKRNTLSQIEFEYNQENNLTTLYEELISNKYEPDYSICFVVLYPKVREVWAANFRDRIVHHLIYNEIKDRYYNRFVKDTYSCIPERGTGNARKSLESYMRKISNNYTKDAYYLKADIKNFFVSIDKDILFSLLEKHINEVWVLELCKKIVYNDPREKALLQSSQCKFNKLPDYKSLWYTPNTKGLPIGNLTSQFFSNVYLNELDQYVKHKLKCKYYCRYVDDFVILDEDPQKLNEIHKELKTFLNERLELVLHDNKKEINKISKGIDFVGYQIKPYRSFLRQGTIKRAYKAVRAHQKTVYDAETIDAFLKTINSYLGMLRGINGYKIRKDLCLKSINLFVGCDESFTKLFIHWQK